jgi:predicted transposase/invertase (TIGR01784 family)
MQVRRYRAWCARSAYYLAKLVTGQLVAGDDYGGLKPAIGIHLLDFDLFQDPAHREQAIWCFEMRDAQTPTVTLGQELQLNLIELRKADRLQQATGALAAWIALFEHWQEDQTMSHIADEPVRAALDKLKHLSADAETRRLAFVRERALHDERSLLKDAREEGREEGREQGKAEALRQTATNLIRVSGLDDADIAAATGLSASDVGDLRQQMR